MMDHVPDASVAYERFCQENGLRIKERERQQWIKSWAELDADAVTVGRVKIPKKRSVIRRISHVVWHTVGIGSFMWGVIFWAILVLPHHAENYIMEHQALYNAWVEISKLPDPLIVLIAALMVIMPVVGLLYVVLIVTQIGMPKQ